MAVQPVAEPVAEVAPVAAPVIAAPVVQPPAAVVIEAQPVPAASFEPAPTVVVKPYALPLDTLAEIARGAGLEWVNSNADKVRQVQEAIANEPKPVRVPREIKPVVLVDDGPLVLVETRRNLGQVQLPFETGSTH